MKSLLNFLIFSQVFLLSCNKGVSPHTDKRLQKIHVHGPGGASDSASITMFYYNDVGDLTKIVDSIPDLPGLGVTHLIYNSIGKLFVALTDSNAYLVTPGTDSFFYGNTGQVQKVISRRRIFDPMFQDTFEYASKHFLTYDVSGKLITDTTYYFSNFNSLHNNDTSVDYIRFDYGGNDDLTKYERFVWRQGAYVSVGIDYATYNKGINPYASLGLNYYLLRHDNTVLSAHERKNLLRHYGGPVDYSYEHFPNGLVKRITLDGVPTKPYITYVDFYYD